MTTTTYHPPGHPEYYLSDQKLTERSMSNIDIGGARIAAALLQVPVQHRSVINQAGTIFCNTTPGWRLSDSVIRYVNFYKSQGHAGAAQAIVNQERERALRERELRQAHRGPGVPVVMHDGTVQVQSIEVQ